MAKVQYKHEKGVLHIGGGRFFYANKPVEVTDEEKTRLLERYDDLIEINDSSDIDIDTSGDIDIEPYTKQLLTKLSKDEQESIIVNEFSSPIGDATNESKRIELILSLQGGEQEKSLGGEVTTKISSSNDE